MSYFKGKMHEVRFWLRPTSKERKARKGGVEGQGRRERGEDDRGKDGEGRGEYTGTFSLHFQHWFYTTTNAETGRVRPEWGAGGKV